MNGGCFPLKDYSGQRSYRLEAVKFSKRVGQNTFWIFRCDCGVESSSRKIEQANILEGR